MKQHHQQQKALTNMATSEIYLSGMCKWAKVHTPQNKYESTDKEWSINLYLDEVSKKAFDMSGLQLKKKEDEEGTFITLRRDVTKVINGDTLTFMKPAVLDGEGQPVTDMIGNGSEVTCKVDVFNTAKGMGHRLQAVRIDELEPYEPHGIDSLLNDPNDVPF